MKHKHAELIHAWADDPAIVFEFRRGSTNWNICESYGPEWNTNTEYRIKPKVYVKKYQFAVKAVGIILPYVTARHHVNESSVRCGIVNELEWVVRLDETMIEVLE